MTGKAIITAAAAALLTLSAAARTTSFPWPDASFTNPTVERTPTALVLRMDIHPDAFDISSNRQAWLRPAVVSPAGDTLWFNPVIVAGRTRYSQNIRTNAVPAESVQLRAGSAETYAYQAIVPYQPWMDLCNLVLTGTVTACAGDCLGSLTPDQPLAKCDFRVKELTPVYIYVSPTEEFVKTRSERGEAYIDFPVGQARILPDYRSNAAELQKIRATIDKVRDDSDITITSLDFTGYASPEGAYTANERLAQNRTQALVDYVKSLYSFPADIMHASWVAEDWTGLAQRVRQTDIADKDALLDVITDDELTPDARDARLRTRFPAQYAVLLANIYPALRRCDYVVNYNIRHYTDVREISAVMAASPQKLSLAELFLYAQSLDKTSPEFKEVMEVAVRMYPTDAVANLNAATTAVGHGEYDLAAAYLQKAGDTPNAAYTAGLLQARQGNYARAVPLLTRAADAGITQAADLLAQMRSFGFID